MTTSTTRQTVNKFPGVEGKEQSSLGTLCTAEASSKGRQWCSQCKQLKKALSLSWITGNERHHKEPGSKLCFKGLASAESG